MKTISILRILTILYIIIYNYLLLFTMKCLLEYFIDYFITQKDTENIMLLGKIIPILERNKSGWHVISVSIGGTDSPKYLEKKLCSPVTIYYRLMKLNSCKDAN